MTNEFCSEFRIMHAYTDQILYLKFNITACTLFLGFDRYMHNALCVNCEHNFTSLPACFEILAFCKCITCFFLIGWLPLTFEIGI